MTGKSGIVQTFPNNLSGPEPSTDAIERLYRVGRQHQLGRSHASVTGSGLALSRRSLSKSGQTPCLCAVIPATSEGANDGSRLNTPQGPKAARRKQPALRAPGSSLARPHRGAGAPPASGSPAPRRRDRESGGPQRVSSAWRSPPSRRPTPPPATAGALKRSEPETDRKTTSKSVGQANLAPHGHAALRTTGPVPAVCPEVRPALAPTPAPARSSRRARRTHR